MSTANLLNIYFDICKNPSEAYKYWKEFFSEEFPIKYEYFEQSEAQVTLIDFNGMNRLVTDEVIKQLARKIDGKRISDFN